MPRGCGKISTWPGADRTGKRAAWERQSAMTCIRRLPQCCFARNRAVTGKLRVTGMDPACPGCMPAHTCHVPAITSTIYRFGCQLSTKQAPEFILRQLTLFNFDAMCLQFRPECIHRRLPPHTCDSIVWSWSDFQLDMSLVLMANIAGGTAADCDRHRSLPVVWLIVLPHRQGSATPRNSIS